MMMLNIGFVSFEASRIIKVMGKKIAVKASSPSHLMSGVMSVDAQTISITAIWQRIATIYIRFLRFLFGLFSCIMPFCPFAGVFDYYAHVL